jgi:hypothetical protein
MPPVNARWAAAKTAAWQQELRQDQRIPDPAVAEPTDGLEEGARLSAIRSDG